MTSTEWYAESDSLSADMNEFISINQSFWDGRDTFDRLDARVDVLEENIRNALNDVPPENEYNTRKDMEKKTGSFREILRDWLNSHD